jgi:hypothetical protein
MRTGSYGNGFIAPEMASDKFIANPALTLLQAREVS